MFAIKIETNEDDIANAIAKLQGLLDKNGKWVFAWSQETKEKVLDSKNHTVMNFAESRERYERCIKGSGRSFFDFMNWAKTQGDDSPFVVFEERLLDAVRYSSNLTDITQTQESSHETLDILALRIDPFLKNAGVTTAEYRRNDVVHKLYTLADEVFQKLISGRNDGEAIIVFLSEQDEAGFLVDGVRPQWYMFSTGKNSFAETLAACLNYDLAKIQNNAVCNYVNISRFENLPQIVSETIMAIRILVTFSRKGDLLYSQNLDVDIASNE